MFYLYKPESCTPHVNFSSPEHEVLRVSYCDSAVSLVRRASCVVRCQLFRLYTLSRGIIFSPIIMKLIIMKLCQNVCLDEFSDEFENGSCRVKN